MGEPTSLAALLSRLEPMIVDEKAAAERDRAIAAGQAYEERLRRSEVLRRERVPLTEAMESALLDGADQLRPSQALNAVRGWLKRDDVPPVIVLAGGTGSGKSVSAAHVLLSRRAGIWRTGAELCRTVAAQFGDQVDDQELCRNAGALVVDDVGAELDPVRMTATLIELIEHRKRSARYMRTVITTNLNRHAFAARYNDARLHSRMAREERTVSWTDVNDCDMRRSK
jgi:DNA replication protein DnaC